jgi:hypothetical protein
MLRLFKAIGQQKKLHNQMQKAHQFALAGNTTKALGILEPLLKEHPTNVYIRHETAILQQKLNGKIDLPTISPSFKKNL